ncbi:hypothetical protein EGT74_07795 [Chitinophaga lutea]|uniref:Uncharacterized protein n=1 Tax=Chitinophaga lutea TaxID=2488634 RepID=A0A3N4PZX4_9BACT|nr:hypothetical protein EGT74_07795 [Chitinophaga lutea]
MIKMVPPCRFGSGILQKMKVVLESMKRGFALPARKRYSVAAKNENEIPPCWPGSDFLQKAQALPQRMTNKPVKKRFNLVGPVDKTCYPG